jgi:hypothetical protein
MGEIVRNRTLLALAVAAAVSAGTAFAQAPAQNAQPQPYRVGTPLGATNEAGSAYADARRYYEAARNAAAPESREFAFITNALEQVPALDHDRVLRRMAPAGHRSAGWRSAARCTPVSSRSRGSTRGLSS